MYEKWTFDLKGARETLASFSSSLATFEVRQARDLSKISSFSRRTPDQNEFSLLTAYQPQEEDDAGKTNKTICIYSEKVANSANPAKTNTGLKNQAAKELLNSAKKFLLDDFLDRALTVNSLSSMRELLVDFSRSHWTLLERSRMSGEYTPIVKRLIEIEGAGKWRTLEHLAELVWTKPKEDIQSQTVNELPAIPEAERFRNWLSLATRLVGHLGTEAQTNGA